MSLIPDRVSSESATTKILTAVHDPANFALGELKAEALESLLRSIGEAGFSKQELTEAEALRMQLAGTPAAGVISQIAAKVLEGYSDQGALTKLLAGIRDPAHNTTPSTSWVDHVPPPPSESTIAGWAKRITDGMQMLATTVLSGQIHRGFHAKTAFAEPATLTLYPDNTLPAGARVGLLAPNSEDPTKSVKLKAVLRGSNGIGCPFIKSPSDNKTRTVPDKAPDVHGLALFTERDGRPSAITATDQTSDGQHVHTGKEFVDFGEAQQKANAKGHLGLLSTLDSGAEILKAFGADGLPVLARITRDTAFPKDSHATTRFAGSVVRLGDYIGKIQFVPEAGVKQGTQGADKDDPDYLRKDAQARGSKKWIICVQLYVDPKATPLDDATKGWRSPLIPVGEVVTHPARDPAGRKAEEEAISAMSFNPGNFDSGPPVKGHPELAGPLSGDTMGQPRTKIYEESAKKRNAWPIGKAIHWLQNISMDGRL